MTKQKTTIEINSNAKYITRQEAATLFSVHPQTITNWIKDGILVGKQIQKSCLVSKESVDLLMPDYDEIAKVQRSIEAYKRKLFDKRAEYQKTCDEYTEYINVYRKSPMAANYISRLMALFYAHLSANHEERQVGIMQMLLAGYDLKDIGTMYGLGKERVSTLIAREIKTLARSRSYIEITERIAQTEEDNLALKQRVRELNDMVQNMKTLMSKDCVTPKEKILGLNITDAKLSIRAMHVLQSLNIKTMDELAQLQRYDVSDVPHAGKKTMAELDELLAANQLHWGMSLYELVSIGEKTKKEAPAPRRHKDVL